MLNTLWLIFLGSIIVLAIALVWVVIVAIVVAAAKQYRRRGV
jgi:hypothetical protein